MEKVCNYLLIQIVRIRVMERSNEVTVNVSNVLPFHSNIIG